ncbi:hypothetical protein AZ09_04150 [Acetobacter aceti 1023]|nr:hypothetical protein AZ09_04150 [Acetobacter aceti 1023]
MDRTTAAGYTTVNGKRVYQDRDKPNGIAGTSLIALDRTAIQEEIMAVIEGAGLKPDASDLTQLFKAISQIATGSESAFLPLSGGILTGPVTGVAVTDWTKRQLVNALDADARYVAQGITISSDTSATAAWIDLTTEEGYPRLGIMGKNRTSYGFYGVAKVNQLISSLASTILAYFSAASGSENTTITNLQGVNWANDADNSYVQVTAGGVSLAVPTIAYVSKSLIDYAQPKGNYQAAGNYQPAGNYIVGPRAGTIIETFSATVSSSGTVNLPRTYSQTLLVWPQSGTDGNGTGMTNVTGWTNNTANVTVASYHTGAPQNATMTQTFGVFGVL